jgi:HNH endonuclease
MTEQTLPVSPTLRAKILAQARYRCGYCLTQQIAVNWLLEVEHIIPTVAGGSDDEDNLWLSSQRVIVIKADRYKLWMCAQDGWYAYSIPVVSSGHGIFGGVMTAQSSLA